MSIYYLSYALQVITLLSVFFGLLKLCYKPIAQIVWQHISGLKRHSNPSSYLLRLFLVNPNKTSAIRVQLFAQSGLQMSYAYYCLLLRIGLVLSFVGFSLFLYITIAYRPPYTAPITTTFLLLHVLILLERMWLQLWVNYRKQKILYDLFQLSYHLLYFADSSMNIYNKLRRSVPYTILIKRDLELLLINWTQNTDDALEQFKQRLGVHEAISFVETLRALRQNQDAAFYTLLRERIEEYKEQLELANESKKETTSYLLFILSGIPILYTFQLFIYPWVKEVQQLLLNMN